jgi:hypothetical protein
MKIDDCKKNCRKVAVLVPQPLSNYCRRESQGANLTSSCCPEAQVPLTSYSSSTIVRIGSTHRTNVTASSELQKIDES